MFKINSHLVLLLLQNYFVYGGTVNYGNPYANNQPYLLHATNMGDNEGWRNNANPDYPAYRRNHAVAQSEHNLQANSNYQQRYRYYYSPSYQQQQPQTQYQPTHLWSGPPIVVEDGVQQQYHASTTNIPPIFYQQHPTTGRSSSGDGSLLLPPLHRNSKELTPSVYNPQTTARSTNRQFNYNNYNNNNNNIVYHRDFRHQIDAIPESQQTQQQDIVSWNNRQQQQHQLLGQQQHYHDQQQQQQPKQFYATSTNLRYNGIPNDLSSLKRDNVPDYREHFKRYLENNPRRIRPVF